MYVCVDSSIRRPNRLKLEKDNLFAAAAPFCVLLFFFVCCRILPPADFYLICY